LPAASKGQKKGKTLKLILKNYVYAMTTDFICTFVMVGYFQTIIWFWE